MVVTRLLMMVVGWRRSKGSKCCKPLKPSLKSAISDQMSQDRIEGQQYREEYSSPVGAICFDLFKLAAAF